MLAGEHQPRSTSNLQRNAPCMAYLSSGTHPHQMHFNHRCHIMHSVSCVQRCHQCKLGKLSLAQWLQIRSQRTCGAWCWKV